RELAAALDPAIERFAFEELHHDVRDAFARIAEVEHLDDTGIDDLRDRARFVEEALHGFLALAVLGTQNLDRRFAAEQLMLAYIDRPHGAFFEETEHAVGAEVHEDS